MLFFWSWFKLRFLLNLSQNLRNDNCGKKYQLTYTYEANNPGVREKIEEMAHNGSGVRDTARVLTINKNTVIIIEKTTKKVLAFIFGDRSAETLKKLVAFLPKNLLDRLDTDNYICYHNVKFTPIHNIGKRLTTSIERKNLDLRNRVKRLGRKTSCFSIPIAIGTEVLHEAVIGRFINLYMF